MISFYFRALFINQKTEEKILWLRSNQYNQLKPVKIYDLELKKNEFDSSL